MSLQRTQPVIQALGIELHIAADECTDSVYIDAALRVQQVIDTCLQ